MIIDSIMGLERYRNINSGFEKAFKFLRANKLEELCEGRHDIDGDNVFAIISERKMIDEKEAKLEVHDSYIDIQVPVSSIETFGWKDRTQCNDAGIVYDEPNDVAFFEDEPSAFIVLDPYQIVIFFPYDAHAPLIGDGKIKKIVIKVRI